MVFLLECASHGVPCHRLCAKEDCCELLCDRCLPSHARCTHHPTAIILNEQALDFFQRFTHHIHLGMLHWAETARKEGWGAVFAVEGTDGAIRQWRSSLPAMSNAAAEILQEHARLMASNRDFAATSATSPLLYHPDFLRDLANLITHPWTHNARLILIKFAQTIATLNPETRDSPASFIVREELAVQIQNYRQELLKEGSGWFLSDLSGAWKEESANDGDTEDRSSSSRRELSVESQEVSQFRLPPSIQVIESFEQIESPAAISLLPARTALIAKHEQTISNTPISNQEQNTIPSTELMVKLQSENQQLQKENSRLKNEVFSLTEDNQILKDRCERIRAQRKPLPSSGKKYKELELNSQLLGEIVELESELTDNRHDIQILVEYLNALARSNRIAPNELASKMTALRTVSMH